MYFLLQHHFCADFLFNFLVFISACLLIFGFYFYSLIFESAFELAFFFPRTNDLINLTKLRRRQRCGIFAKAKRTFCLIVMLLSDQKLSFLFYRSKRRRLVLK